MDDGMIERLREMQAKSMGDPVVIAGKLSEAQREALAQAKAPPWNNRLEVPHETTSETRDELTAAGLVDLVSHRKALTPLGLAVRKALSTQAIDVEGG